MWNDDYEPSHPPGTVLSHEVPKDSSLTPVIMVLSK
jgi:hypothetical protein